ncbi:SDR family oxidoreductase [Larkinella soli]|uniref:SDR family oxidoreductase n=1 Tax=Larkinella soli TaxID=1770527 RepID=UPI000FFB5747|nr:SDR family oxidoreductase [Larkinella soli]
MNPLIVVTGGTKGIGRAIVERFAEGGFDVVASARSEKDLNQLKQEIEQSVAEVLEGFDEAVIPTVFPFAADLSRREEVDGLIGFVKSLNRPVSALVNNAGIFLPGQIHNEPEGTFETTMALNVTGVYHLTRGLLPDMIDRRSGHLFMMGSTASIMAYPNGGSYCISKFALLGMAKVLREELREFGIRVTTLLPGATYTDSWAGSGLPEARFMKAADVADVVWTAYNLSAGAVVEEILLRPQLGDIK